MATFRKRDNGKIIAEVCVRGARKSRTFENKTKTKNWAAEVEAELSSAAAGVSKTHTLGDVFQRYAEEISPGKKGARWETIRLNKFLEYPIASVRLRICAVKTSSCGSMAGGGA